VKPRKLHLMTTKFLIELIQKSTRVILPEFGAFLIKDDGTGVFKPENITFSPFLRYNDGVVEDALSVAQKIGKDKAKEQINSFIELLHAELAEKKEYELEGLGFLYSDIRGSVHFSVNAPNELEKKSSKPTSKSKPADTKPLTTNIIEVPKTSVEKEEIVPTEDSKNELIIEEKESKDEGFENVKDEKPIVEKIEEPTSTPSQPKVTPQKASTHTSKPTHKPKPEVKPMAKKTTSNTSTGKAILTGTLIGLAFVVVLAGGWYLYDSGMLKFSKDKGQIIPIAVKSDVSTDIEKDENSGKFDDEFSKLSAEMDEPTKEAPEPTKKSTEKRIAKTEPNQDSKITIAYPKEGMFHIIAGSFRNSDYAEKFSSEMKTSGFNSKVIQQPTGMYAVTLGSFLNRQQAVDSMNQWKLQYPNIWILQQ
jgi:nucleoid DNA-binding protein